MSGAFVLSVGRSGSTLLTRMLQQHPSICSISEYWTSLFMESFGDPVMDGRAYWQTLAQPPVWYTNFVEKAQAAGQVPTELIYVHTAGRYSLSDCPPILTMTLPALSDQPDELFDELAAIVPSWPRRRVTQHSRQLFEWLSARMGRQLWVERSGLSYWYVPDLRRGFPDAKYVHLLRDGREVLLSMMNMRLFDPIVRTTWLLSIFRGNVVRRQLFFNFRGTARTLLMRLTEADRALTGQHGRSRPYSLPERFSHERRVKEYARFWVNTTELGLEAIAALPPSQVHTVRYEELVENPRPVLAEMIDFLRPGEDHGAWLDAVVDMPRPRPGRWSEVDPKLGAEIGAFIGPTNAKLGYG